MEYRRLGSSGMYVSEISYGNWITHGSQVEQDAAIKCVHAALDVGITTFDTAADAGTELSKPIPNAATATSAMRLKFVFVDICFLSLVVTRNFLVAASR